MLFFISSVYEFHSFQLQAYMFAHLDRNAVIVTDDILTKEQALTRLVGRACEVFGLYDPDEVLTALIDRESKLSTGIGLEVAVPHCRTPQVRHVVMAAMLAKHPVEYNSVDMLPVRLILLLLSPEHDITGHLASLSSISLATSDEAIRSELLSAADPETLFRCLERIH